MRLRDLILLLPARRLALILLVGAASALASAAPAAASPASCTITWTGAAGDGLWSDPGNWSLPGGGVATSAPSSGDTVCIGTAASVQLDEADTISGLELDGATLTADGSESLGVTTELDLQSPGPATPDVLGAGLTLEDDATTTVGANAAVCTAPDTLVTIEPGVTVTLAGQADLGAGDDSACDGGTGGGQIVNQGAITSSGGGGTVTIDPAFFDNEGAVTVSGTDTLAIPASSTANGDTGTYTIDPQATLDFSGTERDIDRSDTSGPAFGGGGTLVISGGLTDFQTDADLSGLGAFTVGQPATAEVDEDLESPAAGASPTTTIAGDLDGYGTVTVSHGTNLSFARPGAELGGYVWLMNDGSVSLASGSTTCIDAGAMIENRAGGTLTLGSGAILGGIPNSDTCGDGTLQNDVSGSITSVGAATIDTGLFDNAGTVDVPAGTLMVDASNADTDTGSYSIGSSATLSIQAGATRVLDGTMSGAGKLQLSATGGSGTSLELSPGASASVGSLGVAPGTTLQIDAGSSTPLASSSSPPPVSVSGMATLNGTLAFDGDALPTPTSTETLALLSFGSRTGTPSFPADDNGWSASLGTIEGAPGIVATLTPPPPQNETPPQINGTAAQGATLTVTPGTWSGSPTGVSDQWQDCDPTSLTCADIPGATGRSYTLTAGDVGEQIQVVETASNAGGASDPASSDMTDVVTTLAPVNLSTPEIGGDEGTVGEVLTEIPGEWQNSPAISLQWEDCDITGITCTPIPGATGPTYTTTENDVNDSIVVVETGTNAYGSAQAASEPTEPLMDLGIGGDGTDPIDGSGDGSGGSGGRSNGTASVSVPAHTVSGTDLSVALRCPQQASCPVTITLTATEPASRAHAAGRGRRARSRIVVVGSQTVTISAGHHRAVTVALNRTGTRLLRSEHTLRAVLTASSRHRTLATTPVTFTAVASGAPDRSPSTHRSASHRRRSDGHRAAGHRHRRRGRRHHRAHR